MSRKVWLSLVSIWIIVGIIGIWLLFYYLDPVNVFPYYVPNIIPSEVATAINLPFSGGRNYKDSLFLVFSFVALFSAGGCVSGFLLVLKSMVK